QAKEITKYVEVMAARMKDAGGDSQAVVEAFKLMTKGSPEAIRLQSLAGIRGPEQAGTPQAFQGIDRMIKSLVRAAPNTRMYTIQLEQASKVLGLSTETIAYWHQMMEESNKPLDANT